MTTGDLLNAWRDATRATELAERLADAAAEAAHSADITAEAAEEVAAMAERTATMAMAAAERARGAASHARRIAVAVHDGRVHDAEDVMANNRANEDGARVAYHQAEDEARAKDPAKSN